MTKVTIATLADVTALEARIRISAVRAIEQLVVVAGLADPLAALAAIKFTRLGCDPLSLDLPFNLIEQVNQTFTYWASCAALRWLFAHHLDHAPFLVNLGTANGRDIASADGRIQAEVFAATHPASNDKLRKDAARLREETGVFRYVFYLSPETARVDAIDGVQLVRLPFPSWEVASRTAVT